MPDYYITCVEEAGPGEIETVGTQVTLRGEPSEVTKKQKREVIMEIDDFDMTVVTAYLDRNREWQEGTAVHTVEGKWIRTDGNETRADNLGGLPHC